MSRSGISCRCSSREGPRLGSVSLLSHDSSTAVLDCLPGGARSGGVAASKPYTVDQRTERMRPVSESAEESLQDASTALRRAVEVLRRRPVDDVAAKSLVGEFHELRTLMSTATVLMQSLGLSRYAGLIRPQGLPAGIDQGPTSVLEEADVDLSAASDHLRQAAGRLTAARQKLDMD